MFGTAIMAVQAAIKAVELARTLAGQIGTGLSTSDEADLRGLLAEMAASNTKLYSSVQAKLAAAAADRTGEAPGS